MMQPSTENAQRNRLKWLLPARHVNYDPESVLACACKVRFAFIAMFLGYAFAFVYYHYNGIYLGRPYPKNTFLYMPSDHFADFSNMVTMASDLQPYHTTTQSNYPPFGNIFFYLFSKLPASVSYCLYIGIPVLWACLLVHARLAGLSRFDRFFLGGALALAPYPVLLAIDRGNLDIWIYPLLGTFLLYAFSSSLSMRQVANLSLAFAIALKVYPAIFLLILVKERRINDIVAILVVSILFTLLASAAIVGGIFGALGDYFGMLGATQDLLVHSLTYANNNTGLYYGLQLVGHFFSGSTGTWDAIVGSYNAIAAALLLVSVAGIYWLPITFGESSLLLAVLACLLPSLSFEYRLVCLLFPLIIIFVSKQRRPYLLVALVSLLLIPKNYLVFHTDVRTDIGISSIINPALLAVLLLSPVLEYAPAVRLPWGELPKLATLRNAWLLLSGMLVVFLAQLRGSFTFGRHYIVNAPSFTVYVALLFVLLLHLGILVAARRSGPVG